MDGGETHFSTPDSIAHLATLSSKYIAFGISDLPVRSLSRMGDKRGRRGRGRAARSLRAASERRTARNACVSLAWRGIGDFAEDSGAARTGGGGEVGRAVVERFVGEEGEGEGFFGGFGDVEVRGRKNLDYSREVANGEWRVARETST